jgi:hypothetical protein
MDRADEIGTDADINWPDAPPLDGNAVVAYLWLEGPDGVTTAAGVATFEGTFRLFPFDLVGGSAGAPGSPESRIALKSSSKELNVTDLASAPVLSCVGGGAPGAIGTPLRRSRGGECENNVAVATLSAGLFFGRISCPGVGAGTFGAAS